MECHASNPFVRKPGVLGEIYAYGVRNPQRFGWDPRNGNLFVADIGQDIVEELSLAPAGANLGWNKWEGSFGFISRQAVSLTNRRGDPSVTYPVAEYGQLDPLLQPQSAVTGVHVYRHNAIPQLANLVLFGDFPSGEIFYIQADKLPSGGQDAHPPGSAQRRRRAQDVSAGHSRRRTPNRARRRPRARICASAPAQTAGCSC